MALCTVTGILRDMQGNALANTIIDFHYPYIVGIDGGVASPDPAPYVMSDENGLIEIDLYPGNCKARIRSSKGTIWRAMAVPDALTADLALLIDAPAIDVPTQALTDATAVLAAMEQIVNVVVLDTAAELPVTPLANVLYLVRS